VLTTRYLPPAGKAAEERIDARAGLSRTGEQLHMALASPDTTPKASCPEIIPH
jgi:hypothetical protein